MAISKTQQFFENLWYKPTAWWLWLFLPFQWLLSLLVQLRRSLYGLGIFKSYKAAVPVIVIGNINVGGTGKTPFAIFLLNHLKEQGFKPGLVTRGYGSDTNAHPQLVCKESKLNEVGDEPLLIYRQANVPIVVDYQRARGAELLQSEYNCDIIVCDDGLQHYKLQRDIEVLIVDKERLFGNGWLMPFGPLRESIKRGQKCDLVVINGEQMRLKPQSIKSVGTNQDTVMEEIKQPLTAIAAIGNPQRFFNTLESLGYEFSTKIFPDHHKFIETDFTAINGSIMMTEKDAVKCTNFTNNSLYYLPVKADICSDTIKRLDVLLKEYK